MISAVTALKRIAAYRDMEPGWDHPSDWPPTAEQIRVLEQLVDSYPNGIQSIRFEDWDTDAEGHNIPVIGIEWGLWPTKTIITVWADGHMECVVEVTSLSDQDRITMEEADRWITFANRVEEGKRMRARNQARQKEAKLRD